MPKPPPSVQERGKAVRLVRLELQARLGATTGMQVDFLDTFLLGAVGSQRQMLHDKLSGASPELRRMLSTSLVCHGPKSGASGEGGGGGGQGGVSAGGKAGVRSAGTAKLVLETPRFSTHEVIDKAIETVVRQDAAAPFPNSLKSVLAQGFQLLKPNLSKGGLSGGRARMMRGVQSAYPNTTVNLLSSRPMTQLHTAVGDGIFLHLLLHTVTLVLLPNTCYLQVTGPLMGNLLQPKAAPASSQHARAPMSQSPRAGALLQRRQPALPAARDKPRADASSAADNGSEDIRHVPGAAASAGKGREGRRSSGARAGNVYVRRRALRVRGSGDKSRVRGSEYKRPAAAGAATGARCAWAGRYQKNGSHPDRGQRKSVLGFVVPRWKVLHVLQRALGGCVSLL